MNQRHKYQASAPKEITKTARDYRWLLPVEMNPFTDAILAHGGTGFASYEDLKDSMRRFFTDTVLPGAGAPRNATPKKLFGLRTVRAFRATEYIKLLKEYEAMDWEPKPINPLSHTDLKTTLKYYAEMGADDILEARLRCIEKHYSTHAKDHPWMREQVAQCPTLLPAE